jgi:hypothetical protein
MPGELLRELSEVYEFRKPVTLVRRAVLKRAGISSEQDVKTPSMRLGAVLRKPNNIVENAVKNLV